MEYPDIVYKYRSWDDKYHRRVLTNNQLYLSSPQDLNDPFDCKIPVNFTLLDTQDKIEEYVDQAINRQRQKLIANGKDPIIERENVIERMTKHLSQFQLENEEMQAVNKNRFYGILSLSSRWDSILMWSHYGGFHKGYCVGFHEEKLRESGLFGSGGNVIYSDDMPEIDPRKSFTNEAFLTESHTKLKEWEYEKEYRLAKLLFTENPNASRIVKIDDSYYAEIILGLNIEKEDKEEIIRIASEKSIPIYQAVQKPFKFKLDRVTVEY